MSLRRTMVVVARNGKGALFSYDPVTPRIGGFKKMFDFDVQSGKDVACLNIITERLKMLQESSNFVNGEGSVNFVTVNNVAILGLEAKKHYKENPQGLLADVLYKDWMQDQEDFVQAMLDFSKALTDALSSGLSVSFQSIDSVYNWEVVTVDKELNARDFLTHGQEVLFVDGIASKFADGSHIGADLRVIGAENMSGVKKVSAKGENRIVVPRSGKTSAISTLRGIIKLAYDVCPRAELSVDSFADEEDFSEEAV